MLNSEEGLGACAVPSPRVRSLAASEFCDSKAAGTTFSETMSESEADLNSPEQWRRRKVKFLCSFGGSILPRPYDGKLRYVGGETRIVRVSRDISFSELVVKMSEFYDQPFTIKYQLPEEEDLDALVSVLSDDDLANMMEEYDKLEATDGFTRLRVFLFSASEQFDVASVCVEADVDQRFVDALNGLPESTSSSDLWRQHTEFLRRNESYSSLSCVGLENGLNPRRILPNSPVHQDTILVASPPLSPLRQPSSPFEESSDHYRQEHQQLWTLGRQPSSPFEESSDHYRQEHQQSWTLGNYPRKQDSAPSMATAGGPFQEVPMSSEAVLGYQKYKHSMKVFPSNEVYYTGSPEFESPRDINRMEVANHWPEDNHKHPIPVADIVSHQVNVHQHHISQQQPPQHQQQNLHPVHQAAVGYCPPEFFQHSEVSSPQRKIAMQPVKYSRLFEPLEQNEVQYPPPEVYEGERSWHIPHQPLSLPVTPDFANTKVPQVKLGSQNMAVGCRIGEGLGRSVLHHAPSASELDRYLENQRHAQGVWQYESRLDYGSTQSSPHFEPANSIGNHNIHLSCGRNVNQQHCQLSGTGENVGLIGQNISQIHGRFERNSAIENPYERQFACDTRSSIMHAEHSSYYQDQCGSNKLEFQVHNPQSVTKEGLLMRTASTKVDQLPPSIDKVQTDIGYRDRVDKARAWLHSTNYQRDSIHMPYAVETSGVLTTEEGIFKDASQNSYAEYDSRWLNPEVVYHDPSSADLYKHATGDQYELNSNTHVTCNLQHMMINNPVDSDLVVHLGSTGGQSQWCYSSGDERGLEFACAQRNAENMEMLQHSYGSSDKNEVDVHNFAGVHITDDFLQKEIVNISEYEEDPAKEFNQNSGPEITKEIQGDHPPTVSSHYQMQMQLGGLIEQVSVAVVNSESSVTIANTACSHIRTSSKVFLPNSLTLRLSTEILSSALPSAGPPIYDQSPVNSTNIAGPKDLLSETEREGQFNESENPELKTIQRGHLTEKIVSNMEVARNDNLEKDAPDICLKDRPEKGASGKSGNLKSAGQGFLLSASATTSTTQAVEAEPLAVSTREEDCKEVEQKVLAPASSVKDDPPEEKLPEENALRLEDVSNGSVNKANDNVSGPEADDLAQGLQTIRNDDLEEIRELGSGTYGTVYYGKWKGSDVAIKRIKASCFAERASEMIADFWKEARILGQLHHPNVVAFYGVVRDGPDGTLATVTEYMVNGSLKQVLHRKDRTIDRRKRLIIARDAAFGMEYLHEKKIVHFDLKCDNLLVNMKDPHRPICKIGDLGLSKIKHQTLVSGGVRGTLPWMAPELLIEEKGMVTEKVDVYSFGIVMWELLTGEEPYANMHFGETIGGILNNTLRPTIPDWCREPAWRSLMERCWSFDPGQRPSFSEIATELRAMGESMNIK